MLSEIRQMSFSGKDTPATSRHKNRTGTLFTIPSRKPEGLYLALDRIGSSPIKEFTYDAEARTSLGHMLHVRCNTHISHLALQI